MPVVRRRHTLPYCTCTKQSPSFTCLEGRWVHVCCRRESKVAWLRRWG